jgi:two-component system chemotaxis response regulator CheB
MARKFEDNLQMDQPKGFVIVVGASAGGLRALKQFIGRFPKDINASIAIVLHLSIISKKNFLVEQLQQHTSLVCQLVDEKISLVNGHIYIAPPNRHILIKDNEIFTGQGAKENGWRPSIDVLFRSAAVSFNSHSVGIILTGLLNDGTAGMIAIKKSGGITIVQDPDEAEYPEMPAAVLEKTEVDYTLTLDEMAGVIEKVLQENRTAVDPPRELKMESEIAANAAIGIDKVASIGEKSIYTCPDCGGGLWSINEGNITRYRCHVGHSFSERQLLIKQAETLETTLWVALRMMEERRNLLLKLKDQNRKRGLVRISETNELKAEEMTVHIDKLREILFVSQTTPQEDGAPAYLNAKERE